MEARDVFFFYNCFTVSDGMPSGNFDYYVAKYRKLIPPFIFFSPAKAMFVTGSRPGSSHMTITSITSLLIDCVSVLL